MEKQKKKKRITKGGGIFHDENIRKRKKYKKGK